MFSLLSLLDGEANLKILDITHGYLSFMLEYNYREKINWITASLPERELDQEREPRSLYSTYPVDD